MESLRWAAILFGVWGISAAVLAFTWCVVVRKSRLREDRSIEPMVSDYDH